MTPKSSKEFYRLRYSKPSEQPRYRVLCDEDDPAVTHATFEILIGPSVDLEFDLDARDELGQRVQRYRLEEVSRVLDKLFEFGVAEGTRRVRETLKEVIGLDLGR